ncbi:MAG: hypothetical protein CUN55_05700 [Phototrophicales bacterium]|nr:MAG: hypothetical protein CUN55_05700 [Phototrophicales bacterium]
MKPHRFLGYVLLIALFALAACNNNSNDNEETPPDTQALLSEAANNFEQAESFRFELRQRGAPIYINFEGFEDLDITLNSATAIFQSPNSVRADISVAIEDVTQKIGIIAVEDRQYYNHPLLTGGEWVQESLVADFEPSDLVSEQTGIGTALRSIQNPTLIGNTEIEGIPVYHIQGMVDAQLARAVTFGLMSTASGNIQIDIYIRREGTRHLSRIELIEPSPPDTEEDLSKTWEIDFEGYNQEVNIDEPTLEN